MGKLVAIDFACNDPDDGLFAGKVAMGAIDGNDVETPHGGDVTFTELLGGFRIHRKSFVFVESKHWVGNWCWNRYWLTVKEANRLVEHLRAHGWHCTCGEERFYERFNAEARP
jgi:hypothetical protein